MRADETCSTLSAVGWPRNGDALQLITPRLLAATTSSLDTSERSTTTGPGVSTHSTVHPARGPTWAAPVSWPTETMKHEQNTLVNRSSAFFLDGFYSLYR